VAYQPITVESLAGMPARRMARCLVLDNGNLASHQYRGRPLSYRGVRVVLVVWLYPWCPWPKPIRTGSAYDLDRALMDAKEYVFLNWWF